MNSRRDTQDKDELLGAALRRLDVPEHGPDFFSELRERVEAEDSAERSGSRRSTASRHPWWRRPVARLVAVPLVAAAMLVIWAWSGRPVPDVIKVKPATAAEVQAKLDTALRTIRSLRGVLVVSHLEETTGAMDEMRWTFASTARGDFRLSGVSRQEDLAYDAATGVERVLARDGDWVVASERIGLAAGRPDPWPSDFMLERELGSVVRALRNAEDPGVRETTLDGRPVWVLDAAVQPNRLSTGSGDHLEVTVDQATGFAVRIVESRGGQVVYEIRLEDLEIDPALPADTFTLRFPEGVEVGHLDQGFRRVDLDQVEGAVGYAPLVPAWVPEGYELTEVAVAAKGGPPARRA
ncbi:MAG: hypothetical protein M5U22_13805 [Thermoleophilia bacterium]|nr:hypothetical protein [Thermoleophilia bacterium]